MDLEDGPRFLGCVSYVMVQLAPKSWPGEKEQLRHPVGEATVQTMVQTDRGAEFKHCDIIPVTNQVIDYLKTPEVEVGVTSENIITSARDITSRHFPLVERILINISQQN